MVPAFPTFPPTCSLCHTKGIQSLSGDWPGLTLLSEDQVGKGCQSFSAHRLLLQVNLDAVTHSQNSSANQPRVPVGDPYLQVAGSSEVGAAAWRLTQAA